MPEKKNDALIKDKMLASLINVINIRDFFFVDLLIFSFSPIELIWRFSNSRSSKFLIVLLELTNSKTQKYDYLLALQANREPLPV